MIKYEIAIKNEHFYIKSVEREVEFAFVDENSHCEADNGYYTSLYDVNLSAFEVDYYKAHYAIWKDFIKNTTDNFCLICEEGAKFKVDMDSLHSLTEQLPDDVELFLPFDRFNLADSDKVPEICTSILGYFIGCPVYFLTRKGAERLLTHLVIKMPLDETILSLSSDEELVIDFLELNLFDYDYTKSPSYLSRKKVLKETIFNSRWRDQDLTVVRKLISCLADYCTRLKIDLVIHAGSLVGAVRHGGIMPWDDDVDFAIHHHMVPKLMDLIKKEDVLCIMPRIFPSTNSIYYKCWIKDEGEETPGYNYRFPFVDIWLFYDQEEEGYVIHKEGHRYPKNICMPFKDAFFEGSKVKIPNDPLATLDMQYPGWREMIVVYPSSHRLKKKLPNVLSLPICVNEEGAYLGDI